ncbi:hypothetical protein WA158_001833 [Blastocystis sp. Blastoise]
MSDQHPERSIFIGNIPYDATEDELRKIFETAGPVVSFKIFFFLLFKLVKEQNSTLNKGYAFCEYQDKHTAECALKNLREQQIKGRILRIDTADGKRKRVNDITQAEDNSSLSKFKPKEIWEFVANMKRECVKDRVFARKLLMNYPQVVQFLQEAEIDLGILTSDIPGAKVNKAM